LGQGVCAPGESYSEACGFAIGECTQGTATTTCTAQCVFGGPGPCQGGSLPIPEVCDDGKDNDCNGAADDCGEPPGEGGGETGEGGGETGETGEEGGEEGDLPPLIGPTPGADGTLCIGGATSCFGNAVIECAGDGKSAEVEAECEFGCTAGVCRSEPVDAGLGGGSSDPGEPSDPGTSGGILIDQEGCRASGGPAGVLLAALALLALTLRRRRAR
jgi:MYXO-CTERM domain-containing protein